MKKLMMLSCVLAMSAVFVGCNKAPKVPEDTLVAVYVDIPQAAENIGDFFSSAVDQLPDSKREKAEKMLEKITSSSEDDLKALRPEWMVAVVCGDEKNSPRSAYIVKCDYEAEIPGFGDKSLKDVYADLCEGKEKVNGETVYMLQDGAITYVERKGDMYMIVCDWYGSWDERGEKMLSNLIDIYRDDKGDVSEDFDDLNKLDGDAIARVQTAKVRTLFESFGFKNNLEKFAEKSGDEDFIEDILDGENLTLDIVLSGDEVGMKFEFEAGSKELAKAIEGVFNIGAVTCRTTLDMVTFATAFSKKEAREKLPRDLYRLKTDVNLDDYDEQVKAVSKLLRDGVEVDRSGSFVTAEILIDTDDLLAEIIPVCKDEFFGVLEVASADIEESDEDGFSLIKNLILN